MTYNIQKTILRAPAKIGQMSCVGVYGNPPFGWGNYFWLLEPNVRVLNFWAENLKAAREQLLVDGEVQIIRWEWDVQTKDGPRHRSCCIIQDDRIPVGWYYNKCCFTGDYLPPVEVAKEIYEILGDPTNELEQFTDPEMYHARRGGMYHTSGAVVYNFASGGQLVENLIAKRLANSKGKQND